MQNTRYERYSLGDLYSYSFFGLLIWNFVLGTLIYLAGFVITMGINDPQYMREFLNGLSSNEMPENVLIGSFLVQTVANFLPMGLIFYIFRKDLIKDFREIKKEPINKLAIIIVYFIIALVLSALIGQIYQKLGIGESSENQEMIEKAILSPAAGIVFIAAVINAPVLEELIFRKALFGFFEHRLGFHRVVPLIISTLLFAFVHVMTPGNLKFIFMYLPLSFAVSYSFYKSDNLLVPIGIHLLNNILAFILAILQV